MKALYDTTEGSGHRIRGIRAAAHGWTLCAILGVMMALSMVSCGGDDEEKLAELPANASGIDVERAEKDRFLKSDAQSPIPADMRAAFAGLSYFPYEEKYVVIASFEPATKPDTVKIPASQGEFRSMVRAGVFSFLFDNGEKVFTLTGYRQAEGESKVVTIPFKDKTSGSSSYGAGRYLDIDEPGEECTLDFNKAYNPYCAYNEDYSCLLVPPQNVLTVAVMAGEKTYHAATKGAR
ncbi:MAG: DUF1684 domain-containing protein [Candidatus Kapaibacterium sp.]